MRSLLRTSRLGLTKTTWPGPSADLRDLRWDRLHLPQVSPPIQTPSGYSTAAIHLGVYLEKHLQLELDFVGTHSVDDPRSKRSFRHDLQYIKSACPVQYRAPPVSSRTSSTTVTRPNPRSESPSISPWPTPASWTTLSLTRTSATTTCTYSLCLGTSCAQRPVRTRHSQARRRSPFHKGHPLSNPQHSRHPTSSGLHALSLCPLHVPRRERKVQLQGTTSRHPPICMTPELIRERSAAAWAARTPEEKEELNRKRVQR